VLARSHCARHGEGLRVRSLWRARLCRRVGTVAAIYDSRARALPRKKLLSCVNDPIFWFVLTLNCNWGSTLVFLILSFYLLLFARQYNFT
jgi:hypothetical protein